MSSVVFADTDAAEAPAELLPGDRVLLETVEEISGD